ncbi:arsenite efflux MFS transporter ArsK [uncultured Devosia sp.]|uniref:arsenite efflux MFS transporter ArsK n=1 Tax=uncultured Devosia sp. TaxID=211434 RepID=UPI0035CB5857
MTSRIPARAIWALGVTQIIGYGTLYYSFSAVAPTIGQTFGWPPEWIFGALTIALLAGGLISPFSGHLVDRFGAARTMTIGSIIAAASLALAAVAADGYLFSAALLLMELASTLVLYAAAFAALVQLGGRTAQRSITHLTLIAGFASTIFWPLTATLLSIMDWRAVYGIFAAINLLVCAPLHFRLGRMGTGLAGEPAGETLSDPSAGPEGVMPVNRRRMAFGLLLFGFAIEGFVLSAILLQIVPILTALGMGSGMLLVTSLFGPAQVLSRLTNMMFGKDFPATRLGIVTALLLPVGIAILALTAPSIAWAVAFAVMFGLGSGLTSIISGSLPLELYGRERYGAKLGWLSSARQTASAVSPFILAVVMGQIGVPAALWATAGIGSIAIVVFAAIAVLATHPGKCRRALLR